MLDRAHPNPRLSHWNADQLYAIHRQALLNKLTRGVCHEINNHLSLVLTHQIFASEVLADADGEPEDLRAALREGAELLGPATAHAHRIGELVRRLASRVRSHEDHTVDIAHACGDAIELMRHAVRVRPEIELHHGIEGAACEHGERLSIALAALLINAAEALEPLPPARRVVRVTSRSQGACIVLEVCDEGPGVVPELMERVFEPFFTTKDERDLCGLGLTVASDIANRLGGRLELDSEPGRGTSVRLELAATAQAKCA